MRGVNKVILIGTLGKDPEVRYSTDGRSIATMSLATNESWKDKQSGEQKESTEWHRVVVYNQLAEIVAKYLKKGSAVYFEGKIKTKKWKGDDGVERYTTEIVASEMQMLGGKAQTGDNAAPANYQPQQQGYNQAIAPTQAQAPASSQRKAPPAGYQGQMPNQSQPQYQQQGGFMPNADSIDFDDDIPF